MRSLKLLAALFAVVFLLEGFAFGDVKSSKANSYMVVAPKTGEMVSKTNGYVVITQKPSEMVSKANGYVVITQTPSEMVSKVNGYVIITQKPAEMVSKAIAYMVLTPGAAPPQQPSIFIVTKNEYPYLQQVDDNSYFSEGWLVRQLIPKSLQLVDN